MTVPCDSIPARAAHDARAGLTRPYPHHLVQDRSLPDGTRLRIRPISPEDRLRHWRFVCSLSLQTRYQRLMSARCLLPGELRRMVEIDYEREMALVAVAWVDGEEQEVGVARYVREDPADGEATPADAAEFAIVITDAWQRRGIGRLLLHSLKSVAAAAGVDQLGGLTLATNAGMLRLARGLGFEISREPDDWTVKRITWRRPAPVASLAAAAYSADIGRKFAAELATDARGSSKAQ